MKQSLQNLSCLSLAKDLLEGLLTGNICITQYLIEIYFLYRNREEMAKRVVLPHLPLFIAYPFVIRMSHMNSTDQ